MALRLRVVQNDAVHRGIQMKAKLPLTLVLLVLFAFPFTAAAQKYPERPIRVIIPFAAGTGTDILARILSEDLRTSMGASFVIDNRAGGSGQIAAELAAKANPDGYTLFL